ncbi:D-xylose ABC transporter ATP-binding protein, partial [Rhizobium ruizarguesonis]
LDEPTRGIDVGAKAEIHRLVTEMARDGVAVVMISSEMPEVLGMSDRIMVMHEGRVTGFLNRDEATQIKVMELAAQ